MAFFEGSSDGTLNGTTPVVVVPAPSIDVRRIVKTINVHNSNDSDVQVTINYVNSSSKRKIWRGVLSPGDTWQWGDAGDVLILDAVGKSIEGVLSGSVSTQPDFVASWGDAS